MLVAAAFVAAVSETGATTAWPVSITPALTLAISGTIRPCVAFCTVTRTAVDGTAGPGVAITTTVVAVVPLAIGAAVIVVSGIARRCSAGWRGSIRRDRYGR